VINLLPLTIESMVAVLLLFTILYCVRLNAQLRRLKADEGVMKSIIAELSTATENAERAISGLKATVREADHTLGAHLKNAERFCNEIKTGTAAGADVLNRITQIAGARPWLHGVSSPDQPQSAKAATPDPKSIIAAAQALAERAHARAKAAAA
jgi:hypothetical protein